MSQQGFWIVAFIIFVVATAWGTYAPENRHWSHIDLKALGAAVICAMFAFKIDP